MDGWLSEEVSKKPVGVFNCLNGIIIGMFFLVEGQKPCFKKWVLNKMDPNNAPCHNHHLINCWIFFGDPPSVDPQNTIKSQKQFYSSSGSLQEQSTESPFFVVERFRNGNTANEIWQNQWVSIPILPVQIPKKLYRYIVTTKRKTVIQ